ncbi:hypothetical protein KR009_011312 [Drosophila setifemur]|nr:hypothetical protein KR009_011312 [Drosophila setifemur]
MNSRVSAFYKWMGFCFLAVLVIYLLPWHQNGVERNFNENITRIVERSLNESKESESTAENESLASLYFVESATCKIPYVDPFDAEASAIYHPFEFESCSNESALVTPIYDEISKRYVLHINETMASLILNSDKIEFNCAYQEITRDPIHDSFKLVSAKSFSQGFVVPPHVQGLITSCHRVGNISDVLQADAFSLIQYAGPPVKEQSANPQPRKPSVIMFGIDNLSRINLRRTMPKVYNFLTRNGWYEMQGYNKIGDNTFPNLMAILTGYSLESAKKKICDWKTDGCLNRTPFVWKHFRNASYLTAYAEDESSMSTFNYLKPGFVAQPTAYYQRPFHMAFESFLPVWKCRECSMKYCIGRRITSSYVYDFGREFVRRYVDERPIWGLFWSNSFSHDDYRLPSKMDDYVLQYMLDFEEDGVFEQSIMIFLSDQGNRYGPLMSLSSGFLENRLPTMFIYLPPWFRAHYPEYAKALQVNQRRLTSNYDLYNTLLHIIELGSPDKAATLPRSHDCPKCKSLFEPAEELRTCEDAGIPEHYCTCVPYKTISAKWTKRIANQVIRSINGYLAKRKLTGICANLTLSYVHTTGVKIDLDRKFHDEVPDVAVYRTKFKVKQGSADFQATVIFNNITGSAQVDVPTISRLNSYEKTAFCIKDKIDKLYCICLNRPKN